MSAFSNNGNSSESPNSDIPGEETRAETATRVRIQERENIQLRALDDIAQRRGMTRDQLIAHIANLERLVVLEREDLAIQDEVNRSVPNNEPDAAVQPGGRRRKISGRKSRKCGGKKSRKSRKSRK